MIVVTGKDTGMAAYIFVKELIRTERMKAGPRSFTRVFLKNDRNNYEYFLDVQEKPEEIARRIKEERHIPGDRQKEQGD